MYVHCSDEYELTRHALQFQDRSEFGRDERPVRAEVMRTRLSGKTVAAECGDAVPVLKIKSRGDCVSSAEQILATAQRNGPRVESLLKRAIERTGQVATTRLVSAGDRSWKARNTEPFARTGFTAHRFLTYEACLSYAYKYIDYWLDEQASTRPRLPHLSKNGDPLMP